MSEATRILVVSNDTGLPVALERALAWKDGFELEVAASPSEALRSVKRRPPAAVMVQWRIDPATRKFLDEVDEAAPDALLILLAAHEADAEALREAYPVVQEKLALNQLESPHLPRTLRNALRQHHRVRRLEQRVRGLEARAAGFRSIITTTADGIVIIDRDGNIGFANPAAEQLFGRSNAELIGQPFGFPLVSGETTEIDVIRGSGDTLVAELRVTETDWRGSTAKLASLRDITERRREEEHARELIREQVARSEAEAAERRARFVGELSSILAESLDDSSTLERVAERSVPFLGDWCIVDLFGRDGRLERTAVAPAAPAHEPLARAIRMSGPDLGRPCGIAKAVEEDCGTQSELVTPDLIGSISSDPEVVRALVSLELGSAVFVPLRNTQRTFGCISWLARSPGHYGPAGLRLVEDVGRRVAVAIENSRLYREAQEANRAKADFLAVMSHELRTPLNAVIGYSDLLLLGVQSKLSGNARDYVQRIQASARHLLLLIDEILTFARSEAGREAIRLETVTLNDLVRDVSALTELLALEKGIAYRLESVDGVTLETDPGKVRQILVNLLSNAVKFTDEGQVELLVSHDHETLELAVRDTGSGIAPAHMETIFEPFWQAEQSHARRAEGTGLGLTVARRLARLLGGDVRVDSTPGSGTTFTVHLPRGRPQETEAAAASQSPEWGGEPLPPVGGH